MMFNLLDISLTNVIQVIFALVQKKLWWT